MTNGAESLETIDSCGKQSVPARGSGWVRSLKAEINTGYAPTRYREVVLTASE
jgi:hypothetical protein